MKKVLIALTAILLFSMTAFADKVRVVTTYPYIANIVEHIGKGNVNVRPLARGDYDPHTITPKPSFIAKLRNADLLVINGAQLEIGWLPPLLKQANNPAVNPGSPGFLDLSLLVKLVDVPKSVSREQGDMHPDGNPHYYLDPHNIPMLAKGIASKLSSLDSAHASIYAMNLDDFLKSWNGKCAQWDAALSIYKGKKVIEYHKNYDYLLRRYGIQLAGTIEPLPGIPPTSKHVETLEKVIGTTAVWRILQDVYNSDEASRHLSKKFSIKMVKLPHDIGAVSESEGIFSLFDEIVRRLTHE